MKRSLIALGVAAAVTLPTVAVAAPDVYGRLNVTIQNTDQDGGSDVWEVKSNSSRFGVKGSEKLSENLAAVYQVEWQVNADGDGTDLGQRNRFLGLQHETLGTLKAGRIDTYFKQAELRVDQFNDITGDLEGLLGAQGGPARANNVIDYSSPKLGDVATVNVQLIQDEGANGEGLADGVSASVVFGTGALTAVVAVNQDVNTRYALGGTHFSEGVRVAANYDVKDLGLRLGALYQAIEADAVDLEEDALLLSAALKFADKWTAKGQFGQSSTSGLIEDDRTQVSVGLDYAFAKTTRALSFVTLQDSDLNGETTSFGVGLEHNF